MSRASMISFLSLCILSSAAFGSTSLLAPQNSQETVLKKFGTEALQDKKSPGHATAIALVSQYGTSTPVSVYLGVNGLNDPTPIDASSVFQIASITKSFIVIVMLQLAEEKKFNLDDPTLLKVYFPEYPHWNGITLRQLMNMTSGIPGNENGLPDDIYKHFTATQYSHYISPTQILNLTYAYPVHFKPGKSYEYSNTNYTLLGEFIRRVTHQSPEKEVETRIIKKLDLKNTFFPINIEDKTPGIRLSQIVHGYNNTPESSHPYPFIHKGQDITEDSLSEYNTQGGMISTPSDINIYLHALYNPGLLLNADQIKQLTTLVSRVNGSPFNPQDNLGNPLGYGLGIVGYYWPEKQHFIYLYNGQSDGFNFVYFYDPETQQYLTFAINNQGYGLVTFPKVFGLFKGLSPELLTKNMKN